MVDAYETYKQQWTSSGDKKLVKDASKALKEYQTRVNSDITDSTDNSHIGVSTFDDIFIYAVENEPFSTSGQSFLILRIPNPCSMSSLRSHVQICLQLVLEVFGVY